MIPPLLSLTQLCVFWVTLVDDNIFLQCLEGLTKYHKPWTAREELHTMGIDQHGWNLRWKCNDSSQPLLPWGNFYRSDPLRAFCRWLLWWLSWLCTKKVLSIWVVLGKLPNFKIQILWGIFIWTKWNEIIFITLPTNSNKW